MNESEVQQQIQIAAVGNGCQLLRNNSGAFTDATGRHIRFGLGNVSKKHSDHIKSSDLIGFTRVTITPDMVGRTVAIFTAVEVKKPNAQIKMIDAKLRAQMAFIEWITKNGGFAGFARSVDEFRKIIGA